MFCAGWSRWSTGRPVLFVAWVTPVIPAAMKVTWVSPGGDCGPKGFTKKGLWDQWFWSISFWLDTRMLRKGPAISLGLFNPRKSLY